MERVGNEEEGRGDEDADEDEEDADFDPFFAPDDTGMLSEPCIQGEEEGCVVDDHELGLWEEEYDGGFLELGSDHEHEEEDDDDDDENDDDGEVDDEVDKKEDTAIHENHNAGPVNSTNGAALPMDQLGRGKGKWVEYATEKGECSSPHEGMEDELMGNALEALPELHSPSHEKYVLEGQGTNSTEDEEAVMDAISKRTRAHYSLADMTLDQLETFLQESDEDDYFHNVDDEEEYRKFLSAVTQTDAAQGEGTVAKDDEEDEDEDDDADFELEIEEALESDSEENQKQKTISGRRPETRVQRRERMQNKERPLGLAKTPLRPLVPYNGSIQADISIGDRSKIMLETAYRECQLATNGTLFQNCFTAHQIGQLYCLIHEHVQLLVQVFSLCILEPSRQQIAIDTHRMLMELVNRRDSPPLGKMAFPDVCLRPPYIHASVNDQSGMLYGESASNNNVTAGTAGFSQSLPSDVFSSGGTSWAPSITQPVYSVLGVAPLGLVKDYLEDLALVVQEYKQRHVQTGAYHSRCEREPLFSTPEHLQLKCTTRGAITSSGPGVVYPFQPQIKKTMAAILVENTKRQIIALVPKSIVTAASRFIPFFNPALFPHKPPPAATANRLLFTDAEDELLAMGLMTFNTDWKAIQQRFLPTKSTHQIFVRQKNRSSARAPENSIKAVRRMKNSPLTLEERDNIQEALRYFKYDWNKVWQLAVPHRDPALLPRQWRTAIGTQKSYKSDEISKEKRRLHEANKRRMKALQNDTDALLEEELGGADARGEVTNSDEDVEDSDETHIHEAFLSNWRPEMKSSNSTLSQTQNQLQQSATQSVHLGSAAHAGVSPRKRSRIQTIKLAPGLPLLNLPPHVRVISQSSFQSTSSTSLLLAHGRTDGPQMSVVHTAKGSDRCHRPAAHERGSDVRDKQAVQRQKNRTSTGQSRNVELQLHPLLLQPSYASAPANACDQQVVNTSLLTSNRQPSHAPAFHPFFAAKPPGISASAGEGSSGFNPLLQIRTPAIQTTAKVASKFHPLLQQPLEKSLQCTNPPLAHEKSSWTTRGNQGPLAEPTRGLVSNSEKVIYMRGSLRKRKSGTARNGYAYSSAPSTSGIDPAQSEPLLPARRKVDEKFQASKSMERAECNMDIVMEQEELSDSKNEADLEVQFECEEMCDSDKEYSQSETPKTLVAEKNEQIEFEEEEIGTDSESEKSEGSLEGRTSFVNVVEKVNRTERNRKQSAGALTRKKQNLRVKKAPVPQRSRNGRSGKGKDIVDSLESRDQSSSKRKLLGGSYSSSNRNSVKDNVGSRSAGSRGCSLTKTVSEISSDPEPDVNAIEAAHVLAVIHQNPSELRKPF